MWKIKSQFENFWFEFLNLNSTVHEKRIETSMLLEEEGRMPNDEPMNHDGVDVGLRNVTK